MSIAMVAEAWRSAPDPPNASTPAPVETSAVSTMMTLRIRVRTRASDSRPRLCRGQRATVKLRPRSALSSRRESRNQPRHRRADSPRDRHAALRGRGVSTPAGRTVASCVLAGLGGAVRCRRRIARRRPGRVRSSPASESRASRPHGHVSCRVAPARSSSGQVTRRGSPDPMTLRRPRSRRGPAVPGLPVPIAASGLPPGCGAARRR